MGFSNELEPHREYLLADYKIEKNKSKTRWPVLILGCLTLFGCYYAYDLPAALKTQLDDFTGNKSSYEINFGLLYSLYSAPNVNQYAL
jgi:hypothetical protein